MSNENDQTAQRPGLLQGETPAHPGTPRESEAEETDGQVSEVGRLDDGDSGTPIQPSDSTAGYPDSESGDPDTRGAGPDAAPPENRSDNDFKPKHRKLDEGVNDL
jgi:hypothetical protein